MSSRGRKSTGNAHKDDDDLYLTRERKSLPNIHRNKSELSTSKHLTVSGDRISLSYPSRNYIFHRSAFDWYNNKRALVLDDMEEILPIAGSLNKPHVRSIFDSSHLFKSFSRYSEPAALANDTNEKNIRTPIENDDYEDKKDKTLTNETELQLDSDQDNKTASNKSLSTTKKPFRILILHGYKHNKKDFYDKTEFLRNEFKDLVEFVYVQAPHFIAKESPETNFQEQHAWWLKTKEFPGINFAANFDRTLDYLNKIFLYKGPFDGVFGFSQGGATTAILCNILTDKEMSDYYTSIYFKFAILVGTCRSDEYYLSQFYDSVNQIDIPTLHIFGRADTLITCDTSLDLTDYFYKPKIYFHEYGHTIPGDEECMNSIRDFLEEMNKKFN